MEKTTREIGIKGTIKREDSRSVYELSLREHGVTVDRATSACMAARREDNRRPTVSIDGARAVITVEGDVTAFAADFERRIFAQLRP